MKSKLLLATSILFSCMLFFSCKSDKGKAEGYLPGDLVSNPNTAEGKGDLSKLPVITFEQKEHDFGKIMQGESVSYEFSFTNTGKSDLVISDVSTSCGCTVPSFPRTPIRPGGSGKVKVMFNSRGKHGLQTKNVVVVANTQPNITQLKIKAQVDLVGVE